MTSVLPRKGDKECDKVMPSTMRDARDEEPFRGQYLLGGGEHSHTRYSI